MAISGTLDVLEKQVNSVLLKNALIYLSTANHQKVFEQVTPDHKLKVNIDGTAIFAVYQTYTSKLPEHTKMEGHQKYIDIQFIFEGMEQILLATEKDIVEDAPFNEEKDVFFPTCGAYSLVRLRAGEAAVLFPEDLHGPGCCIDSPASVKKIVIKVTV